MAQGSNEFTASSRSRLAAPRCSHADENLVALSVTSVFPIPAGRVLRGHAAARPCQRTAQTHPQANSCCSSRAPAATGTPYRDVALSSCSACPHSSRVAAASDSLPWRARTPRHVAHGDRCRSSAAGNRARSRSRAILSDLLCWIAPSSGRFRGLGCTAACGRLLTRGLTTLSRPSLPESRRSHEGVRCVRF